MAKTYTEQERRAQFAAAVRRGARVEATEPHAASARYTARARAVVVELTNGATFSFPVALVPSLAGATDAQLAGVEVGPAGVALSWPALDEDLTVSGLARLVFGRRAIAGAFAAGGGSVRSTAKAKAARANGAKGGRPRKTAGTFAEVTGRPTIRTRVRETQGAASGRWSTVSEVGREPGNGIGRAAVNQVRETATGKTQDKAGHVVRTTKAGAKK